MEILLASHNLHKIREFREMFRSLPHIELLSLLQFSDYQGPEETALTFKGNATLKAEHAAKHFNKWTLADDSGLIVPALNGEPGVHSARYAGPNKTDADNRVKLIANMKSLNAFERTAYYECCLTIASPDGIKKSVEGTCEGRIALEPRGSNGFGYDSIFIKTDYGKTFGELDDTIKNRISHRRKAFERLISLLETLKN